MMRWRAPKGTAALLRERVSGCRRSPRPPAITIPRTRGMCATNGPLRARVQGGASGSHSTGRAAFQPAENAHERVRAEVTLREGEPVALTLRSSTTFYGRTPAGAYQSRARDLKSVEFAR